MCKNVGKISNVEKLETISMFTTEMRTPHNETSLAQNVDLYLKLKESHDTLRKRL